MLYGWGENEQGWHTQGNADLILGNLIEAKKAGPMIITMDSSNAVKPGEDSSIFNARGGKAPGAPPGRGGFTGSAFTDMMLADLIPMIERTYRVLSGRENRAMAGLSMGGMQTFRTALANPDKLAYLGGFNGGGRGGTFDPKSSNNGVFADAAAIS